MAVNAPGGRACPNTSMSRVARTPVTPCSTACSWTINPPMSTHSPGRRSASSPTACQSEREMSSRRSNSIRIIYPGLSRPVCVHVGRRVREGPGVPLREARDLPRLHRATATGRRSPTGSEPAPAQSRERVRRSTLRDDSPAHRPLPPDRRQRGRPHPRLKCPSSVRRCDPEFSTLLSDEHRSPQLGHGYVGGSRGRRGNDSRAMRECATSSAHSGRPRPLRSRHRTRGGGCPMPYVARAVAPGPHARERFDLPPSRRATTLCRAVAQTGGPRRCAFARHPD